MISKNKIIDEIEKLQDYTTYSEENYKKHYGFIYITKNLITNKYYIGQKRFDNKTRWNSYLGSGYWFVKSVEKYGKENFIRKIIEIADYPHTLDEKEYYWIKKFNAVNDDLFYNMIDGGNVTDNLNKKHSTPVICLFNGYIFKSIKDAGLWSGQTDTFIKKTFELKYDINNKNDKYFFRPLSVVKKEHALCQFCAKNYKKKSNGEKRCDKCKEKIKDHKIIFNIHKPSNENIMHFKLSDNWVTEFIHKKSYSVKALENDLKSRMNRGKSKLPYCKNEKMLFIKEELIKNKDIILKLYLDERMSISRILKEINIVALNSALLKEFIKKSGVTIRKDIKEYINYLKMTGEDGISCYFKSKQELKDWLINNTYLDAKELSGNRFNYYLNNGYHGYLIEKISEKEYFSHKEVVNE